MTGHRSCLLPGRCVCWDRRSLEAHRPDRTRPARSAGPGCSRWRAAGSPSCWRPVRAADPAPAASAAGSTGSCPAAGAPGPAGSLPPPPDSCTGRSSGRSPAEGSGGSGGSSCSCPQTAPGCRFSWLLSAVREPDRQTSGGCRKNQRRIINILMSEKHPQTENNHSGLTRASYRAAEGSAGRSLAVTWVSHHPERDDWSPNHQSVSPAAHLLPARGSTSLHAVFFIVLLEQQMKLIFNSD